jgi:hypothetical protein
MINDLTNNLQIDLFKGPDSLINFALSKKFDEHLSLARPGRRIREELEDQWMDGGEGQVGMAERDRSDKRGERGWGVDTGWKVFLTNQACPRIYYKNRRRSRRLLRAPTASAGDNFRNAINR